MSLQLPAILSPPTPCIPSPALTVSPLERSPKLPCPLRVGVRFWASLTLRKLANASGRIVFNIVLFMDWQFITGCLPPRLSTTQFPSTTDSQCSVRWGLPPHCWCALSGARRDALPRDPRQHVRWSCPVYPPPMVDALRRVRRRTSGTLLWTCGAGRAGTRIRSEALHQRLPSDILPRIARERVTTIA